ncbi:hypothetical protein D9V86_06305 [Bacteroidetes/Chlorobi group bacterium ChocPot_Mid]|nr:MAG: hypothetical protein D9V86_06305 [Bacteroidetes/Chlorobi group bacterium ChocPot_Mid]
MDENQRKYPRDYSYYEWSENVFKEIETKIADAETSIRKFSDLVDSSPQHALEFYSQDLCIATHILLELRNFQIKLEGHPSLSLIDIIKDTMGKYLNSYKNRDFQATSNNLITNAINIYRNMAYANLYEMFERATKLYARIKQPNFNNPEEQI